MKTIQKICVNKINPFDAPRAKARGLLRVDTERRLFPRPKGLGLGAVECINSINLRFISLFLTNLNCGRQYYFFLSSGIIFPETTKVQLERKKSVKGDVKKCS